MTDNQWETLIAVLRGETIRPIPTGFIIDSPWLPKWAGHTLLDYFTSEEIWIKDNFKAIDAFPRAIFLPGFWSEYGMCTEPSAFGAVGVWEENEFPFAKKTLRSPGDIDFIEKPDPSKDGLLPFVIKRLKRFRPEIEKAGHKIRFAVARGPLNIASFLMGTTAFLETLKTDPERIRHLLAVVTDFIAEWIALQRECFPSIDGILVLDDIVGFLGKQDFVDFGLPLFKRLFGADVSVKLFHNDAPCRMCAPFLSEIGVNLLNFGVQHTLDDMRAWAGDSVALLGNIPPRDVLAEGHADDVRRAVQELLETTSGKTRLILSCGGGMPPGAPSENIRAFIETVDEMTS